MFQSHNLAYKKHYIYYPAWKEFVNDVKSNPINNLNDAIYYGLIFCYDDYQNLLHKLHNIVKMNNF